MEKLGGHGVRNNWEGIRSKGAATGEEFRRRLGEIKAKEELGRRLVARWSYDVRMTSGGTVSENMLRRFG